MSNHETPVKTEKKNTSSPENQKTIQNHKTAAKHHEEAAKHHHEAADHHEAGNDEKAAESTVKANGHHLLATDAQQEDAKLHAGKK